MSEEGLMRISKNIYVCNDNYIYVKKKKKAKGWGKKMRGKKWTRVAKRGVRVGEDPFSSVFLVCLNKTLKDFQKT